MRNIFCLGGRENTLAVARYAGRMGVGTVYFDFIKTRASYSKHITFHEINNKCDNALLMKLLEIKNSLGGNKEAIFFNNDHFVKFAIVHRKILAEEFRFIMPKTRIIECALDKERMGEIIPQELLPHNFEVKTHYDLINLEPPIFVKPKNASGDGLFKTKYIKTLRELKDFANKYEKQLNKFVYQGWVNNSGGRYISVLFYRSEQGEFRWIAIERERMVPYWGGVGCLIRRGECKFIGLIENLLSQMNYVGIGEIDTLESPKKITIFDLNARLPSWTFFSEKCGIDLIGIYLRDTYGDSFENIHVCKNNLQGNIKAIDLINDFKTVFSPEKGLLFNGKITISEYFRSLLGIKYFYTLSLDDLHPFLYILKNEILNLTRGENEV